MAISFDKLEHRAPSLVSLAKKAQFNLSKHDLAGHSAKVALCLDYSGSMRSMYKSGQVQELAERVLALATQIDDDGSIDLFFFGTEAWYAGELSIDDFRGGIDRAGAGRHMGRTNYAGAISLVRQHFGREVAQASGWSKEARWRLPVYCMFVTDGAPDSRRAATEELKAASSEGIFWQFMGVGEGPFDYLRKLDEMGGRSVDNANFFEADDLASVSDQQLFSSMLAEYPSWLREAAAAGVLT